MDRDRWASVREIFTHLRDQGPSFRRDYLDMVCADDCELRRLLEAMLGASDNDDTLRPIPHPAFGRTSPPPRLFREYELGEPLGRGGMGDIYRATHPQFGDVALKFLSSPLISHAQFLERFRREAAVLQTVRHPALSRFFEIVAVEDKVAIAMEFIEGEDLGRILGRQTLSLVQSLSVAIELSDVLAMIHEKGVVHRDVKPSNVMITRDGGTRLIDFGVARVADARLTATGQKLGSPCYMSPEQWRGEAVDSRSDIWSLGVLLFYMCWQDLPFKGENLRDVAGAILGDEPVSWPISSCADPARDAVAAVVARMLQKDLAVRYGSMHEVRHALTQLRSLNSPQPDGQSGPER